NDDDLLMFLCLPFLFFLLVEELAVIHDAADRRLRGGRNLHQVEVLLPGLFERLKWRHDADLVALVVNHANFARANAFIRADKTLIDTVLPAGRKALRL